MPSTVFDSPTALGAKIITVETTVTNISGSYTTTVNDERITVAMKAINIEIEHPEVFNANISVTCNNGSVTITCANVSGESDITLSILKVADDPTAVTSTEFDILDNRKVNKQQNVSDSGKVLGIGSDGIVTPVKVGDGTLRVVPFSIGVASWTLSNGVYSYTFQSAYVTLTSVEFIEYDSSYRNAVRGDVNATKATGGGGVVFTTDVLPVATLSGEIRVFDSDDGKVAIVTQMTALPTMREVPFTITASQWALNADDLYEAVFTTSYVTSTSHDFVEFDESIENATDGIKVTKASTGMKFLSRRVPAGSISGTITPLDNADGKIAVVLEDTVVPISNGGTGASSVAGAKENLGITALENKKFVQLLAPTSFVNGTDVQLSDSIENYDEIYVEIYLNTSTGYRSTSLNIPVLAIKNNGYGAENQHVVSGIGTINITSSQISYCLYAQVSFKDATTFHMEYSSKNGWSGSMYVQVYAK